MKTTLLYLFVCASTQLLQSYTNWYIYENQEISIEFPNEPEVTFQKMPSTFGDIEVKIATYDGKEEDNFAYNFSSTVYPDSMINLHKKDKYARFFRGSIDGAVKNVNGKLISEKEVTFDDFPGREVKVDYGDGQAIIYMRMFLVQNCVYMIQTISKTGKEDNENALKFHKSFKLKK